LKIRFGHPPGRRRRKVLGSREHDAEVGCAENEEGLCESDPHNQPLDDGAADERGKAKAHDGQSRGQTTSIREPLHQGGNRGDVAHPKTDAAEDPIAGIEQMKTVHLDSEP
jgi:hypothetical protein